MFAIFFDDSIFGGLVVPIPDIIPSQVLDSNTLGLFPDSEIRSSSPTSSRFWSSLFSVYSSFAEAAASTFLRIGKNDLLIYDRFSPVTLEMCLIIVNGLDGVGWPVIYVGFFSISS